MSKAWSVHDIALQAVDRACDWLEKDVADLRKNMLLLKSQGIDSPEWQKMLAKTQERIEEALQTVRVAREIYDNLPETDHAR